MARLMIGGGNFDAGLRFNEERDRRIRQALAAEEQQRQAVEANQRLTLQQNAQRFEQEQAGQQNQIRVAQIQQAMRNDFLRQQEDARRFELERGDRLNAQDLSRGERMDEQQYRRGLDSQNRQDFLDNQGYQRGRDAVGDQRWQAQEERITGDKAEQRRILEQENLRRDEREKAEREIAAKKNQAWSEDREQMSRDRRLNTTVGAIEAQIRAKERDFQLAISSGRQDLVGRLNAELADLEEQKAAALQGEPVSLGGLRADMLNEGEMPWVPSEAPAPRRSVREELAQDFANKAGEKKAEKAREGEVKRQDDFLKDVALKSTGSTAQSFLTFVKSEAQKRGMKPDDPAIQRAIEANPTARELVQLQRQMQGMGPVGILKEATESLQALQNKPQRDALAQRGINVREFEQFLQQTLDRAKAAIQKAEARVPAVKGPTSAFEALQQRPDEVMGWQKYAFPALPVYGAAKMRNAMLGE